MSGSQASRSSSRAPLGANFQQPFQTTGFGIAGIVAQIDAAGQVEQVELKAQVGQGGVGHYYCYRPPEGEALRLKGRLGDVLRRSADV